MAKQRVKATLYRVTRLSAYSFDKKELGLFGDAEKVKTAIKNDQYRLAGDRLNDLSLAECEQTIEWNGIDYLIEPTQLDVEVEVPDLQTGRFEERPLLDARQRRIVYDLVNINSFSTPGKGYTVGLDKDKRPVDCTCEAFQYSKPLNEGGHDKPFCKHMQFVADRGAVVRGDEGRMYSYPRLPFGALLASQ